MAKQLGRLLAYLAFLYALFTTTYAQEVCVVSPVPNTSIAVIFSGDFSDTTTCSYREGETLCCFSLDKERNEILVEFWSSDRSRQFEVAYRMYYGENYTKAVSNAMANITVVGEPGQVVVVEENIDKAAVPDASFIETRGELIVEYDPVLRWYVRIGEDGKAVVYYRVTKGTAPLEGTVVRFASCELEVRRSDVRVLRDGDDLFLVYEFYVYDGEEAVVPDRVKAYVNGKSASVRLDREEKMFTVIEKIGKITDAVKVRVEAEAGECKEELEEVVEVDLEEEGIDPMAVLAVVLLVAGVAAWYLLSRKS